MKRAEQLLANILKDKQFTIALAESITCGLAAHKLGTVSGTSEILAGSVVCYSEDVKISLLGVSKSLIKKHTAESQQVTDAMCKKLRKVIKADVYVAVTGLAAPGGTETKRKPVGTVFFTIYIKGKVYRLRKKFNGSPLKIKQKACEELFRFAVMKCRDKY